MKERIMQKFKAVTNYVCLVVATSLLMGIIFIQVFKTAFPKDPEMEARIPLMEEDAKKRAKALKEMQKETSCKDERFIGSEYCE